MNEPSKLKIFSPDAEQRNVIPDEKPATGYASYAEGFPPESQLPLDSGGVAPQRKDFNGLFYLLSSAVRWIEEGGLWSYENSIDYAVGAIVTDSGIIYRCKAVNGPSSTVKAPSADTARAYWIPVLSNTGILAPVVAAYPVGSIYMTTAEGNPASLLGFGTWEQIQGKFLFAADSTRANMTTGGADKVTLTTAQIPGHTHSVTVNSNGNHTHNASTETAGGHVHDVTTANAGSHKHSGSADSAGNHTHTRGTMEITGAFRSVDMGGREYASGAFRDAEAPSSVYASHTYRKADDDGTDISVNLEASRAWTGATSSAGAHTHTLSVDNSGAHTHGVSVATAGGHTHTVTVNSAGAHTHTATATSTGGGQSHENMPPYLAVNVWRRTA